MFFFFLSADTMWLKKYIRSLLLWSIKCKKTLLIPSICLHQKQHKEKCWNRIAVEHHHRAHKIFNNIFVSTCSLCVIVFSKIGTYDIETVGGHPFKRIALFLFTFSLLLLRSVNSFFRFFFLNSSSCFEYAFIKYAWCYVCTLVSMASVDLLLYSSLMKCAFCWRIIQYTSFNFKVLQFDHKTRQISCNIIGFYFIFSFGLVILVLCSLHVSL